MKRIGLFLWLGLLIKLFCLDLSNTTSSTELMYSVSITGAVPQPGVYRVLPTTRVSELYKLAIHPVAKSYIETISIKKEYQIDSLYVQPQLELLPSKRNIVLYRDDEQIKIDLSYFYHSGDISQNPFLRDGDVIHVGALVNYVTIEGEVNKPDKYEIVSKSTLREVIDFAYQFTVDADQESIMIYRYKRPDDKLNIIKVNYLTQANSFELMDHDKIVVPTRNNIQHKNQFIYLYGEVVHPGKYPFNPDQNNLLFYLNLAGGPLETSNLEYGYLQRNDFPPVKNEEQERLLKKPFSEMTHVEKEFLKSVSRYPLDHLEIDIKTLWTTKDTKYDLLLEPNDFIYIPDHMHTVTINGNVKKPGRIRYFEQKNIDYYIAEAGGFSWNVDKRNIRLIRYKTKEWLKPDEDTIVNPGDMIFIPEKEEYNYWEITKEVLSVVVQFTTLVVLINNLSTN